MKKTLTNILLLAAAITLVGSCKKEASVDNAEFQLEDCSVSASVLGTDTKVALDGTTPKWEDNDQILVLDANKKPLGGTGLFTITSGSETNEGNFSGKKYIGQTPAYAIYPASVYDAATGKFTLPTEQDGTKTTTFRDYAVMMGTVSSGSITFANVCAVLKINTGDYGNGEAAIKSLKVSAATTAIAGEFTPDWTNNTIAPVADGARLAVTASAASSYAYGADVYLAIFPTSSQALTFDFTNTDDEVATVTDTFAPATNTIKGLGTAGGMEFVVPPYVKIEMTVSGVKKIYKWYKQNLAISDSGKKAWKGGNSSAVKVPGTDKDVIVGDYFQWATYAGYCGNAGDADKGLLIYDSFNNTNCVGDTGSNGFTLKSAGGSNKYQFNVSSWGSYVGISPYYSSPAYTKYTSDSINLEKGDDVANIILGDDWRMPTSAEFKALYNVTYWAWDGTDCGCYVFQPGQGTQGSAGSYGTINATTDDKSKALLFFPAAGYGGDAILDGAGSFGGYLYSTLSSGNTGQARCLYFDSSKVDAHNNNSHRYSGNTVRPVSDK